MNKNWETTFLSLKIICSNNKSRWNKTKKTKKLSRKNTKSKGQPSKILAKTNHELYSFKKQSVV